MVKKTIALAQGLCMLSFLLYAGLSSAQSVFDRADSNGSSSLDAEEFRAYMADIYFHLDTDRNGSLAGDELGFLNPDRLFGADQNGDSQIGMSEFLNSTNIDFHSFDRNHNNLLGRNEL